MFKYLALSLLFLGCNLFHSADKPSTDELSALQPGVYENRTACGEGCTHFGLGVMIFAANGECSIRNQEVKKSSPDSCLISDLRASWSFSHSRLRLWKTHGVYRKLLLQPACQQDFARVDDPDTVNLEVRKITAHGFEVKVPLQDSSFWQSWIRK